MAAQNQTDLFDAYFRKADLDGDGQISGAEAVAFFQGSNLPKQVLAQVWMYADQKKLGYLGRQEFYNALKLVTVAQSKRDLTPEMVKAALFGPASARIPAPQINVAATPTPHPRVATVTSQSSGNSSVPSRNSGLNGANGLGNVGVNQQYSQPLQNQVVRPPQAMPPRTSSQIQPALVAEGTLRGGNMVAPPHLPTSNSTNWQSGSSGGFTTGFSNQVQNRSVSPTGQGFGLTASGLTPSMQPRPQATPAQISSSVPKPNDSSIPSNKLAAGDSKALVVSGNGFASDSLFGDVFSTTSSQSKQTALATTSSATGSIVSTTSVPASGPHPSAKSSPAESLQGTLSQQPVGGQYHPGHPTGRQYQQAAGPSNAASSSTGFPAGPGNFSSGQSTHSQSPWPKMTQSDIQKYTKVFVQVDTDRDGKITGDQARSLFLSWRLPREVLKQVWDLSDQDNDSMLSLREFCTALYLMERYREGRPLPSALPSSLITDETLSTSGHPPVPHRNVAWGPARGFVQPQATTAPRPPLPSARGRPPRPVSFSQTDAQTPPAPQKSKVPVLEKNLVDQLSQEEQDSLNSKFKEATDANKKVEELEKEIQDSRTKTEFFRAKMQELILYKSRCDNRLNEITERTSADKREVEALAKKYEEKYKLSGDVASRLTIEESTFRDIQEKKMELYQAIVKIEQGDNKDGALQERANQIQSSLEELVKSLNERCKQYGLRAKPTSLVELPFGWQPGIQEGSADWDEDWDKFEDEGFTVVKELTLDVQNVIAPPKPKSSLVQKETASATVSDANSDKVPDTSERIPEKDSTLDQSEDGLAKKPAVTTDKRTQEFQDSHVTSSGADGSPQAQKTIDPYGSPHAKKTDDTDSSALAKESRRYGGAESLFSEDKSFDEPTWGKFDSQFDPVWGFDNEHSKETDDSIFGLGGFNIKPIKTQSSDTGNLFPGKGPVVFDSVPSTPADAGDMFHGKSLSIFADSVPSTPAYADNMFKGKGSSVFADSVPSTPAYADNMFKGKSSSLFADSVPSTPAYADNMFKGQNSSIFGDSVPSTPAYADNMFKGKTSSIFADSVPSTPAYADDMFKGKSSSPFADSVPSTPAYHHSQQSFGEGSDAYSFDSFSRSDSFNMQDSGLFQPRSFDRFDSMRSSTDFDQGYGFPPSGFDSFNAHDQPDKSLSRFDSMRSTTGFDSFNAHDQPDKSLSRFDSMQSSTGFDHSHEFTSFDDNDPFGSMGPFKTSLESQTPRRDSDKWSAF
ncbi:Arabidopsis thaliana EH domain containing protein 2 [Hibiscus trionum]|uniref:Arabidopsis thaliana EH domain containing protein 2 n=1 Tax=Hibiscus trionum TaxID=183268 RepID=A0A9W7H325_HIBTR|nr:Arabidopsis thaliana EH domain containing protein 2 [Hibiscus trionum]